MKGIKESSIEILGKEVKVAVASGLANARRLLERIRDGKVHYEIIEIMACALVDVSAELVNHFLEEMFRN